MMVCAFAAVKKSQSRLKCLFLLCLALLQFTAFAATHIQVYFSPDGGCTQAVTNELAKARRTVLVQAYSFTSAPMAKAVVDAHRRGVRVTVILDKSQRTEKYSSADFLQNSGITTLIDAKHAIAHNKVMVIAGKAVAAHCIYIGCAAHGKTKQD